MNRVLVHRIWSTDAEKKHLKEEKSEQIEFYFFLEKWSRNVLKKSDRD